MNTENNKFDIDVSINEHVPLFIAFSKHADVSQIKINKKVK
jgi:hypothetical protein